jgi:hypothetical protein
VLINSIKSAPKAYIMCSTYKIRRIPKDVTPENVGEKYPKLLKQAKVDSRRLFGDGCCHTVARQWMMTTKGYDEAFIGWGFEDSDMTHRARMRGLRFANICKKTTMIHLPHSYYNNPYYSSKLKDKNKAYYWKKRQHRIFYGNKGKNWGVI